MSERNYSSYSSQDESRPRSRSSSGRRSSEPRRSKKRGKRSPGRTALWVIGTILLVAVTTGAIMCCFAAVYIRNNILPLAQMDMNDFTLNENSIMYYQDDSGQYQELGQVLSDTSSEWVDFEEIPQDLKDAAVAIEDRRFYTHHGVDWWRTAQAVVSMFTGGDIQGGSTITQQTIKNLTKKNEVTVTRKVQEIFTALYVDETYGKDTVLLYYLNIIPWAPAVRAWGPRRRSTSASPCPSCPWPRAPASSPSPTTPPSTAPTPWPGWPTARGRCGPRCSGTSTARR